MSDFLSRLAGRSMGVEPVVQPVVPAMTAPVSREAGFTERESLHDVEEPREREHAASREVSGAREQGARPQSAAAPPAPAAHRERAASTFDPTNGRAALHTMLESAPHPTLGFPGDGENDADEQTHAQPAWDHTLADSAGAIPSASPERFAHDRRTEPAAAPIVRVTIGRVEVRAELSQPKTRPASAPRAKSAAISLDDYLKQRGEGRR